MQWVRSFDPGHLLSNSALSSYRLCAVQSLATLCLFTISAPGPGDLTDFMVFRHAPIPRKGSGNNNSNSFFFFNDLLFSVGEELPCYKRASTDRVKALHDKGNIQIAKKRLGWVW